MLGNPLWGLLASAGIRESIVKVASGTGHVTKYPIDMLSLAVLFWSVGGSEGDGCAKLAGLGC